jgi:hypothetical protein
MVILLLVLMGWGMLLTISALFGTLVPAVIENLTDRDHEKW